MEMRTVCMWPCQVSRNPYYFWKNEETHNNSTTVYRSSKPQKGILLPGSSIQEISTCLGYGNWLVFSSVWDFHFYSGIIDSHANWMIYKRGPEIIRDLVEHFVVVCGRWLTTVYVNILQVNVFQQQARKGEPFFKVCIIQINGAWFSIFLVSV